MKRIVFGVLAVIVCLSQAYSQSKEDSVDNIMSSYYSQNSPSVGVLIVKDDKTMIKKAYGFANLEKTEEASPQTNYNLGTLSEQFVVMSALILKEQEKLDVKSAVTDHITDLPAYCDKITIQNLMKHNSGLPNLSRNDFQKNIKSKDDLRQFLKDHEELKYKTGEKSNWNALNFALLASVVNNTIETSFHKFVKKNIFKPLEADDSKVYRKGWFFSVPDKSIGYRRLEDEQYEKTTLNVDDYIPGTNGIYSNLNDMEKWLEAWKSDILISKKTLSQIKKINFVRGQKEFLGYGWKQGFNNGNKYFYSGGLSSGNSHIILHFPTAGIDVVILSNQSSLFNLRKNAFKLLNLFSEENYEVK
ncbi:MAG: serine hydrolase domain-containing protein [Bacteroidota bacterium]